jgi:hypothetical protein
VNRRNAAPAPTDSFKTLTASFKYPTVSFKASRARVMGIGSAKGAPKSHQESFTSLLGAPLAAATLYACSPAAPSGNERPSSPIDPEPSPPIAPLVQQCQSDQRFRIGRGSADITGAITDISTV